MKIITECILATYSSWPSIKKLTATYSMYSIMTQNVHTPRAGDFMSAFSGILCSVEW